MSRYFIGLFIFSCMMKVCSGQSVRIVSQTDNAAIHFAHVEIRLPDQDHSKVFESDDKGIIRIPGDLAGKQVVITISRIGFEKIRDTIVATGNITYRLKRKEETIDEVVVTAQYAPGSPEKSVYKVNVIDRKRIEAMGAQNLRDVMTNEMNTRISQDNILGSSVSFQGISGQNVKVLVDGIPVTGRLNGNIDISQINLNNAERIEIVEGPLSVDYGTDALAGTINVITKKSQKERFSVSSNSYYESTGQYNLSGRIGYSKNKNTAAVTAGRNYFDGWNGTEKTFHLEKEHIADSTRYKSWKPKEQYFGTLYYGRYIKDLKLSYTGDYFYEQILNRGIPRKPYFESAFDDYYTTQRLNNALSLTGALNAKWYMNAVFAYNHYQRIKNTYFKDLTTLNEVLSANAGDQDTSTFNDITARGSISTSVDSGKINYEVGYDIHNEKGLGLRIKNRVQQITDYAIFSSAEYKPVPKLVIRPGIRLIYNTAYKAPVVPSVNLLYTFHKAQKIRLSYARGFRAPSLKELYFSFVDINHHITGNEDLKAEQSHNFNLSFSLYPLKNNLQFKVEPSVFYNYIENMISLAQYTDVQYSYFNIDKYRTLGAQVQAELSWKNFRFNVGGGYSGFSSQLQELSEEFTYSPEGRCNLIYDWQNQGMTFAIFYKYTGRLSAFNIGEDNEIFKSTIEDYHTADLSVSKFLWKKKINFSAGIKNIFDVTDITGSSNAGVHGANASGIPVAMGRSYFIKLDITINSNK